MAKGFILFLFSVCLYIKIARFYEGGGDGMPPPAMVSQTAWPFAVLALAADFLEGIPIVVAAGLTFYVWQNHPKGKAAKKKNQMQLGKEGQ